MLEFTIAKTESETCTMIPTFMLNRIEPWLTRNNIAYKVYTGENIPDDMPHSYEFKGHKSRRAVACLITKLNSDELHALVEKMLDMDPENI